MTNNFKCFAFQLLFYVFWFFGREACGILAPRPGIEATPLALEGEVLTTGLPGKSHVMYFELIFVTSVKSVSRFFFCCCSFVSAPFVKRLSLTHYIAFAPLSRISQLYLCGSISGLSVLLH